MALFLQEFNAPDIFMGVLAKSKCPRLRVSMYLSKAASLEQCAEKAPGILVLDEETYP